MDYPYDKFGDCKSSRCDRTAFNMFFALCDPVTLTIYLDPKIIPSVGYPKYQVPNLNTLRSFIFKLSCGQTNKQTDTQTESLRDRRG